MTELFSTTLKIEFPELSHAIARLAEISPTLMHPETAELAVHELSTIASKVNSIPTMIREHVKPVADFAQHNRNELLELKQKLAGVYDRLSLQFNEREMGSEPESHADPESRAELTNFENKVLKLLREIVDFSQPPRKSSRYWSRSAAARTRAENLLEQFGYPASAEALSPAEFPDLIDHVLKVIETLVTSEAIVDTVWVSGVNGTAVEVLSNVAAVLGATDEQIENAATSYRPGSPPAAQHDLGDPENVAENEEQESPPLEPRKLSRSELIKAAVAAGFDLTSAEQMTNRELTEFAASRQLKTLAASKPEAPAATDSDRDGEMWFCSLCCRLGNPKELCCGELPELVSVNDIASSIETRRKALSNDAELVAVFLNRNTNRDTTACPKS